MTISFPGSWPGRRDQFADCYVVAEDLGEIGDSSANCCKAFGYFGTPLQQQLGFGLRICDDHAYVVGIWHHSRHPYILEPRLATNGSCLSHSICYLKAARNMTLELAPKSAAARQLFSILQHGEVLAGIARLQFLDSSDVDNHRAMNTNKALGIQPL